MINSRKINFVEKFKNRQLEEKKARKIPSKIRDDFKRRKKRKSILRDVKRCLKRDKASERLKIDKKKLKEILVQFEQITKEETRVKIKYNSTKLTEINKQIKSNIVNKKSSKKIIL